VTSNSREPSECSGIAVRLSSGAACGGSMPRHAIDYEVLQD